jgi:hypothetical protein
MLLGKGKGSDRFFVCQIWRHEIFTLCGASALAHSVFSHRPSNHAIKEQVILVE